MNIDKEVTVVMSVNHVFEWQTGPSFHAVLRRTPCGPGDYFEIELLVNGKPKRVAINGNSSDFIAMIQDEKETDAIKA